MMNKPKTYLNDENRLNDRYFFVSYSHVDSDKVFFVLHQLYDSGVNFWYDNDLNVGDFWNERVSDVLHNSDCVGAFVFLSENSIVSEPVNKEVQIMLDIMREREFVIAPIVIGYQTVDDLIYELSKKNREFSKKSRGRDFAINDIASDDISTAYEAEDSIRKLISRAEIADIKQTHQILLNKTALRKLPYIRRDRQEYYLLGKYAHNSNGDVANIEWFPIYNDSGKIYLLSDACIDFVTTDEICSVLDRIKSSMGIYAPYILDVDLLNEQLMTKHMDKITPTYPTDYADNRRSQLLCAYWVKVEDGSTDKYVLYNSINVKLNKQINYENINAGIRPVLVIDNKKIKIWEGKNGKFIEN